VFGDERFKFGDQLGVAAERELGLDDPRGRR
jgi:hypothetical protein